MLLESYLRAGSGQFEHLVSDPQDGAFDMQRYGCKGSEYTYSYCSTGC